MPTRILIVEDDQLQSSVLNAAFVAVGHEVETCPDGLTAVWKIREGRFDVVLLDYDLPEIDGLATARLVRDLMGEIARPRLLALTVDPGSVARREQVTGPAFDGIIGKSPDLLGLRAIVEDHLRLAPGKAARQGAELDLLTKEWGEFEFETERPEPVADRPAALGRVLVIEDDELQQSVLKAGLEAHGYEVETASDGLSGVRRMCAEAYDVALIDYELPEIDGVGVARLVGELLSHAVRPRLIALTAAPERLVSRSVPHRIFDHVVGKQEGFPAVLASIRNGGVAQSGCGWR